MLPTFDIIYERSPNKNEKLKITLIAILHYDECELVDGLEMVHFDNVWWIEYS